MKYEVRCCCAPQKLLGWIEWPDSMRIARFALVSPLGTTTWRASIESVELVLADYAEDGRAYKAVKADGVPIEKLRRIPGFVENK